MRFASAASGVQRMLKYHSSCVANGPTPRVTGWVGNFWKSGFHIGFTDQFVS